MKGPHTVNLIDLSGEFRNGAIDRRIGQDVEPIPENIIPKPVVRPRRIRGVLVERQRGVSFEVCQLDRQPVR